MTPEHDYTRPETGAVAAPARRPAKQMKGPLGRVLSVIGLAAFGVAGGALHIAYVIVACIIFAFVGAAVGTGLGGALMGPYLPGQTGMAIGALAGAGFGIYQLVTNLDEILG